MNRKDKEITLRSEMDAILNDAAVCRLAMIDGDTPYMVPLCFGYDGERLYFHCANRGRKLDMLRKNNRVCFEVDTGVSILPGQSPCKWSMAYASVIGFGTARFVEDAAQKRRALSIILDHYTRLAKAAVSPTASDAGVEMSDKNVDAITVLTVEIESLTGKRSPGRKSPD